METIFLFLIVFAFGYIHGWLAHARSFFNRLKSNPDEMLKLLNDYKLATQSNKPKQSEPETKREVEVEFHENQIYLYAKDTGEFLAQSDTLEKAIELTEKRFPNEMFVGFIPKEDVQRLTIAIKDSQST